MPMRDNRVRGQTRKEPLFEPPMKYTITSRTRSRGRVGIHRSAIGSTREPVNGIGVTSRYKRRRFHWRVREGLVNPKGGFSLPFSGCPAGSERELRQDRVLDQFPRSFVSSSFRFDLARTKLARLSAFRVTGCIQPPDDLSADSTVAPTGKIETGSGIW